MRLWSASSSSTVRRRCVSCVLCHCGRCRRVAVVCSTAAYTRNCPCGVRLVVFFFSDSSHHTNYGLFHYLIMLHSVVSSMQPSQYDVLFTSPSTKGKKGESLTAAQVRRRHATMPRQRHRGWSLDQDSRSAFSNVMSTPTDAAKKRSARADGAAALSSAATPESKRVGSGVDVASALFKTLGSAGEF